MKSKCIPDDRGRDREIKITNDHLESPFRQTRQSKSTPAFIFSVQILIESLGLCPLSQFYGNHPLDKKYVRSGKSSTSARARI